MSSKHKNRGNASSPATLRIKYLRGDAKHDQRPKQNRRKYVGDDAESDGADDIWSINRWPLWGIRTPPVSGTVTMVRWSVASHFPTTIMAPVTAGKHNSSAILSLVN